MPFVVVYDANALYPNAQRDLLIRVAQHGLVQAKWTLEILDELTRARLRKNPGLDPGKLDRLKSLMNDAVADCLVWGYEPPQTVADVMLELENAGLVASVAALQS
jgi:hypothetical protein